MTQAVRLQNEYKARIVRKAWYRLRNKTETRTVVAYNKPLALKYLNTLYPKAVAITVDFVRNVPR